MNPLRVVCGFLENEGRILLCRRSPGQSLEGFWEFPGGKIEEGESPRDALRRELQEELGLQTEVGSLVGKSSSDWRNRGLELEAYRVKILSGTLELTAHDQAVWIRPEEASDYRLASADVPLLEAYLRSFGYPTILETIGNTPLVRLQRLGTGKNTLLAKLEGNNPAGSVKDRPAVSMIKRAEEAGRIRPGDTLIEATSGNTGIALAMAASVLGYKMILLMPENSSLERRQSMTAYGAEVILTSEKAGMEGAIDISREMEKEGKGVVLDQFANPDNPRAHYETTGPEIWSQTRGTVTHFVASTGTTGTLMGTGKFLKEKNPSVQVVAAVPAEGAHIPGIRKWPQEYLPPVFEPERLDRSLAVGQKEAEDTMRLLAREEGILAGISSGGNLWAALQLDRELTGAVIVVILCDRGDRYLSTGIF